MTKKIYVIKAGIWCKIGISNNPEKRVCSISTSCPLPPSVVFSSALYPTEIAIIIERHIHIHLAEKQSNNEWFEITIEEAIDVCGQYIKKFPHEKYKAWIPKPQLFDLEEARKIVYNTDYKVFNKKYCGEKYIPLPHTKGWKKKLIRSLKKYHGIP